MLIFSLDRMLMNLRDALSPRVRGRLNPIIFQMKGNRLPPNARSMLLRQLRSLFPKITKEQHGLLTVYILGEAGLFGDTVSANDTGAAVSTVLDDPSSMCSTELQMLMTSYSDLLQATSNLEKLDANMPTAGNIKQWHQ
jgi:hypothetical protein